MDMGWLPWRKKKDRAVQTRVVVYTREGCHLCADACDLLERMHKRFKFDLTAIDVEGQDELTRLYGERVPVVVVNGKERFWGRINPVLLERLLQAHDLAEG
jgi:glutaredoxin